MQWSEPAFVLSTSRFGEHGLRLGVLSASHGLFHGVVKFGAKKRSIYDIGNLLLVTWSARLAEHMGSITAELITPYAAYVMHDAKRLHALADTAALMAHFLPERLPEPQVFQAFTHFVDVLHHESEWRAAHVLFEHHLLSAIGYGLDLEECAATGAREELVYVSPKTGRAVSREAGAPYNDKLFRLPAFLLDSQAKATERDLSDGFALSQFFFERAARELHKKMPLRQHEPS